MVAACQGVGAAPKRRSVVNFAVIDIAVVGKWDGQSSAQERVLGVP